MKTKTINVYQYSELSDKAKEQARNWLIECSASDSFEWDCIKDDAKTVGIELQGTHRGSMEGKLLLDFSQVLAAILKEHGETCETYKTAKEYQEKYSKLTEEQIVNGEDEELREEFTKSILEDYRIMVEKQEEYCQSEEYIKEAMEANEYEFDINGKRI